MLISKIVKLLLSPAKLTRNFTSSCYIFKSFSKTSLHLGFNKSFYSKSYKVCKKTFTWVCAFFVFWFCKFFGSIWKTDYVIVSSSSTGMTCQIWKILSICSKSLFLVSSPFVKPGPPLHAKLDKGGFALPLKQTLWKKLSIFTISQSFPLL